MFRFFLNAAFVLIGICLYALGTDQTAGGICRNSGRGLISIAHVVDGPESPVAIGSLLLAKGGKSIVDTCSRA
jgi:hypothetical protein